MNFSWDNIRVKRKNQFMLDYSKMFDIARNSYAKLSYNNKMGKALIPLRYFFELTYQCNLNCPYCYVGQDRKKNELTTQEWFDIIDQIPWYSFVTLVGGEPLIRKDFIQILERTAKKTFGKLNVVTNGILIDDEIIDALVLADKYSKTISTEINWILQKKIINRSKGHLSNERRVGTDLRDFVLEIEETNFSNIKNKAVRPWRDGKLAQPQKLLCNKHLSIDKAIKPVMLWSVEKKLRLHFEWVWDGSQIWIVQSDICTQVSGNTPENLIKPLLEMVKKEV